MSLTRRQAHSTTDEDGNELYCITDARLGSAFALRTLPEIETLMEEHSIERLPNRGDREIVTNDGIVARRIERSYPRRLTLGELTRDRPRVALAVPLTKRTTMDVTKQGTVIVGDVALGTVDLGPWYNGRETDTEIRRQARLIAAKWGLSSEQVKTQA